MKFILVSDPKFPDSKPWWVIRVAKGDFKTVMDCHKWLAINLFIKDGNNPHMLAAREKEDPIAMLKHPVLLGAHFVSTAMKLVVENDFYVNQRGGMRPVGDLTEGRAVEGNNWPGKVDPERSITIHTWENHYYLTADYSHSITFLDKFNTEREAMDFALLFAPPDRIKVKREAKSFKEGD